MSKTLIEIFSKYHPADPDRQWLLSAPPESIRLRFDKEQKFIEISASFPHIIRRAVLCRVEQEIQKAYGLNFVHICPKAMSPSC